MSRGLFWSLMRAGSGSTPHPGLLYLQENAKQFFDFTQLSGDEDDVVATVSDLSPNGRDLESVGSPVIKIKQIGDEVYKTVETLTNSTPTLRYLRFDDASYAESMFRSSFEIFATVMFEDAQPATSSAHNYFGCQTGVNKNRMWLRQTFSTPNYFFAAAYRNDAPQNVSYAWLTADGLPLVDGPMGQTLIRLKFDFENDICQIFIDGVEATYTIFDNISSVTDPSTWSANGIKFCLGTVNDQGTIANSSLQMYWLRWAITPILTPQQATDVINYLVL